MLRSELYRAIWNRSLLLAILLGFAALVYGLLEYNQGPHNLPGAHPFLYNAYDAVIWAQKGPISLLVPLVATLPFADSFALDRVQNYLSYVLVRSSLRRYFISKFLTNLLVGGLAVALPLLILFIITSITYPRGLLPIAESRAVVGGYPDGPMSHLYRLAPDWYILFLVAIGFIFGAVYATLSLAISLITTNRYIILATPFLLYHLANFVLAILRLEVWSPPATFIPDAVQGNSSLTMFGELGGIFLLSVLSLLLLGNKKRINS